MTTIRHGLSATSHGSPCIPIYPASPIGFAAALLSLGVIAWVVLLGPASA